MDAEAGQYRGLILEAAAKGGHLALMEWVWDEGMRTADIQKSALEKQLNLGSWR